MEKLDPAGLAAFARKYRFVGGRLKSARVRFAGGRATVEVVVAARTAIVSLSDEPTPVKLRLRLVDAEEYRFQKRPSGPRGRMTDLRLGAFDGLIYLNFDAFPLDPGDKPGVHDFRASDAFAAGKELWWEVVGATA
jgi:hypothetical protein